MQFLMRNQEKQLTAAQRALLDFCDGADAHSLYQHLSVTLGLSITKYVRNSLGDEMPSSPTEKTLEAWYFTLELMSIIHDISVESSQQ